MLASTKRPGLVPGKIGEECAIRLASIYLFKISRPFSTPSPLGRSDGTFCLPLAESSCVTDTL